MNTEIKNEVNSIENSIEVFLAGMSFNNNIPIIVRTLKKDSSYKLIGIKQTILPMYEVNYIDTIYKMASDYPYYNELLLSIGLDLNTIKDNEDLFQSKLVNYLVSNDIVYKLDSSSKNWIIDFPEEIINKVLHSKYQSFMINSKTFFDHFSNENLIMRLRKDCNNKVRKIIKA